MFAYNDQARQPYMVIEHVDGPTLSSLISHLATCPTISRFAVAVDLVSALHYVHAQGLCHLMPPEQCMPGERGPVGPHSDVRSLGATLFRATAGYRAFDREERWAQLSHRPHDLPDFVHPALADLITDC